MAYPHIHKFYLHSVEVYLSRLNQQTQHASLHHPKRGEIVSTERSQGCIFVTFRHCIESLIG